MAYDYLLPLIPRLAGHEILVAGDVFLDEYLIGRTERLSREAPIPVLEFERQEFIPGGAANPSANVAALGSRAIQVGVVGPDTNGDTLRTMLQARRIDPAGLVIDPNRPTTTKTRILAQMGLRFPQQVARIDRIDRKPVNGGTERAVIDCLHRMAARVQAIMVSDYLAGLLTRPIVDAVREISQVRGLLIVADAQGELDKYAGFDLVKCNADDAMHYVLRQLKTDTDFADAGRTILERLNLRGGMLITRGPDGMTLIQQSQPDRSDPAGSAQVMHIPALRVEDVYDTVGAGDTVLAVVTLARVAGAPYPDAAALANLAAGIVVRKVGNYAPSPDDLRAAVHGRNGTTPRQPEPGE